MVVRGGKCIIFLLCPLDRKPVAGLFEGVFEEQCREYCCLASGGDSGFSVVLVRPQTQAGSRVCTSEVCLIGQTPPCGRRLPFLWPQGVFSVPWGDSVWRPFPTPALALPSSRPDHQGCAVSCLHQSFPGTPAEDSGAEPVRAHFLHWWPPGVLVRPTTQLDLAVSKIIAEIFPARSCRSSASPVSLCCLLPPQMSLSCLSFQAAWFPMISAL